jgi:osmotically-inducible protein OsmY
MRKLIFPLILLILLGGIGYYVYTHGFTKPRWLGAVASSSEDVATTTKIKAALGLSNRLKPFDIGVSTTGGVVTLTGEVLSEDAKSLAGEIARDTAGVREVKNEISVNPAAKPSSESSRVEDLEIRVAALEAINRSPELSGKGIDVKVENRNVTLSGTVETPAQRSGAEQLARSIDGVASVTNNLTATNPQAATEPPASNAPAADPNAELAKRVEFELYRTGAFDTLGITIKAEDGAVTLGGNVGSRAEQLLAERVAQGVPGVKTVKNELKVAAAPPRGQKR